jgi:hypothetical protein
LHEIEEIIAPPASTRSGGGGVGSIDAKSAPAGFDNSGCDGGDDGACRDNERKINPAFGA